MVGRRQTKVTSVARQFHPAAGSFDAGTAVTHHQTHATRNLEMVQRYLTGDHFVVRYGNYESLPAFKSPIRTARSRYPICVSPVRSFRHGSDVPAIIQHRVARRVLAIFRGNRIPTRHGDDPICPDDLSSA